MQTISIELQIANRKYPLRLTEDEVEIAREAARRVNERLEALEKQYGVTDMQDLFAMTALQLTSAMVKEEQETDRERLELMGRLDALNKQMDSF